MGSIVLQSTRTDGWSDWAKEMDRLLDTAEGTDGLSDGAKEVNELLDAIEEIEAVGRLEVLRPVLLAGWDRQQRGFGG